MELFGGMFPEGAKQGILTDHHGGAVICRRQFRMVCVLASVGGYGTLIQGIEDHRMHCRGKLEVIFLPHLSSVEPICDAKHPRRNLAFHIHTHPCEESSSQDHMIHYHVVYPREYKENLTVLLTHPQRRLRF